LKLVKSFEGSVLKDIFNPNELLIIAGPCSIESSEQMMEIAEFLSKNNIKFMRAGIFKPRTSPYSFQGLGRSGFDIIKEVKKRYDLKIVSEIVNASDIDLYLENVDIIQVGARNMQNFEILKALGKVKVPVLLKRGFGNTIEEWLLAAEYLLESGNDQVILCERGIRTFEKATRNTLDISSVPVVKGITKLPIIVDPSHASGRSDLVKPLSLASVAAGADGLMIEIHPNPSKSISDPDQAINFKEAKEIFEMANKLHKLVK
jgi:3-deoxy-7-phosphoheptulonate synthase